MEEALLSVILTESPPPPLVTLTLTLTITVLTLTITLTLTAVRMGLTSTSTSTYVSGAESAQDIMWYATQARDAYPYYQHTAIGYGSTGSPQALSACRTYVPVSAVAKRVFRGLTECQSGPMRGAITPMATEDQMTVLDAHIAHHKHVQALYEQLLAEVPGITIHKQPDVDVDANVNCNANDNANVNCGCAKEKSTST